MSLFSKIPIQSTLKKRRIPNAFMLFVKDQKERLVQKCPQESVTVIGTILSKKWKAMGTDEKRVYYDKYNALKKRYEDSSVFSSLKAEDSMDKDLMEEIKEITKIEGSKLDPKRIKTSSKKSDVSSDAIVVLKNQPDNTTKYKTRTKSNSNGTVNRSKSKEGKKKFNGIKNPFLIFAKEKRKNIKASKKSHVSTILGNLWQDLDLAEKKKYFEKAKLAYPVGDGAISSVLSSDDKPRNKVKKKRGRKSDAPSFASENGASSSKEAAGPPVKSEKKECPIAEASPSRQTDAEPARPGASSHTLRLPRPPHDSGLLPYSPDLGGYYRPCFGGGFYPPDAMWTYRQPAGPHWYNFSSYYSHCHCAPQYHAYPYAQASHVRSVFYSPHPTAYFGNAFAPCHGQNREGDADEDENDLVVVDDDPQEEPDSGPQA